MGYLLFLASEMCRYGVFVVLVASEMCRYGVFVVLSIRDVQVRGICCS